MKAENFIVLIDVHFCDVIFRKGQIVSRAEMRGHFPALSKYELVVLKTGSLKIAA